jgi:hypothetical protein
MRVALGTGAAAAVALKRKKRFLGCSLLEHFELGRKVGVGTFG